MNLSADRKKQIQKDFNRNVQRRCFGKAIRMAKYYKIKGVLVTRKTLKEEYQLSNEQIKKLQFIEVDNPHFKCAGNMKLYLKAQAKHIKAKTPNIQGTAIKNKQKDH
ncbi:hypothetical protein [Parvicella tangerina]|uniref:XPA C-terminal domain-containing protein n=1 Tax=Parvicella tangerina TaxID=2829795 RepID=A0A916JMQ2_9FLAO|nr:hypothetical protein [Parvicella tangerina]CAG5081255.1 hypothetical protein CRYO30217_01575 [Parvicella tangerina]